MRKGIIYKITNKVNGKMYIGQTIVKLSKRKNGHKRAAYNKRSKSYWGYLQCAIRKYDWENFQFDVIEEDIDMDKLDEREIYYIDFFDTFKNGYNLTLGGGGTLGKEGLSGKDNTMYGKKWSQDRKKKYSEMRRGINNPNSDKKLYHFYHIKHGEFIGTRLELCEEFNLNRNSLQNIITRGSNHYKGWVMYENKENYKEILKIYDFYHPKYGVYISTCKELSDKFNLHIGNINALALGKLNSSKGWVRLSDKDK